MRGRVKRMNEKRTEDEKLKGNERRHIDGT